MALSLSVLSLLLLFFNPMSSSDWHVERDWHFLFFNLRYLLNSHCPHLISPFNAVTVTTHLWNMGHCNHRLTNGKLMHSDYMHINRSLGIQQRLGTSRSSFASISLSERCKHIFFFLFPQLYEHKASIKSLKQLKLTFQINHIYVLNRGKVYVHWLLQSKLSTAW